MMEIIINKQTVQRTSRPKRLIEQLQSFSIASLVVLVLFVGNTFPDAVNGSEPLSTPDPSDIEYPNDEIHSPEEVALGKMLFFDTRLSSTGTFSCATCHNPTLGFSDMQKTSIGANGKRGKRNTPPLYNLAWNEVFFWDGRADSLENQVLIPLENPDEMDMPIKVALAKLNSLQGYKNKFVSIYGESGINKQNLARAIAAFERTLISHNSPFDQYISGDLTAMQPSAIRGLELFEGKAECINCHDGANFTDQGFYNIGVGDNDPGRYQIVKDESLRGTFKTPGLRNVSLTSPYLHDGSEPTLESVVRFYNRGGNTEKGKSNLIKKLHLTEQEVSDLVVFLGALTDPVVVSIPKLP